MYRYSKITTNMNRVCKKNTCRIFVCTRSSTQPEQYTKLLGLNSVQLFDRMKQLINEANNACSDEDNMKIWEEIKLVSRAYQEIKKSEFCNSDLNVRESNGQVPGVDPNTWDVLM